MLQMLVDFFFVVFSFSKMALINNLHFQPSEISSALQIIFYYHTRSLSLSLSLSIQSISLYIQHAVPSITFPITFCDTFYASTCVCVSVCLYVDRYVVFTLGAAFLKSGSENSQRTRPTRVNHRQNCATVFRFPLNWHPLCYAKHIVWHRPL